MPDVYSASRCFHIHPNQEMVNLNLEKRAELVFTSILYVV